MQQTISENSPKAKTANDEKWCALTPKMPFFNHSKLFPLKKVKFLVLKIPIGQNNFLNFGVVFLTAVKSAKLRKAHCSPPLVGEDNSMVFTSHSVPFPATRDLRSLVAGNGTS